MKSGEYFEKANIYEVNFDIGICISMEYIHVKEYMTPNQVLYFTFQSLCKNWNKWPPLSWDMSLVTLQGVCGAIQCMNAAVCM